MSLFTLSLPDTLKLTDEQFFELCQSNRDYQIERTASGDLLIMPPTGGETGRRNIDLLFQLQAWSRQSKSGVAFDSSTCFKLPNGADRSPDAAWIKRERWNALTAEQKEKFPPICPDFVLELRSSTDSLKPLQEKMEEYRENGARLGWLIDPKARQVEVYRPGQKVEVLENPAILSGEEVLTGFVLNLESIMSLD
jgi:Uma2 family endonuclease